MLDTLGTDVKRRGAAASAPIRVLIVDDSVVARAVLSRLLSEYPDIEVVGQAGSALSAYRILTETQVDIVLLDLEMPGVDGLAALPELIRLGAGARVLIVSSNCADGAASSLAALRLGAADTLLKPNAARFNGPFAEALVDRLRRIARPGNTDPFPVRAPVADSVKKQPGRRLECLGIGSSTGGVHALVRFFGALPKSFTTPILITQHLPGPFMPYFAGQLVEMTGRPTRIGAPGLQPQPGELLLAPGDAHMTLVKTGPVIHVRLERKRSVSGCMPSVDPMLASLGRVYGAAAVGIVLSGMGRDGVIGAGELVDAGGLVLAQDEASSVVWGMPGAVVNAQLAQATLPPDELARQIAKWSEGVAAWK
ncbi:MAG TPA: chemotaxis-specific protein-glutamate methyltransferase CheB [Sphingomonas sp.]|nr:chemotaxis-specific protein-glutamate methyltransferase CheB [Sphingomonas sp.]